MDRVGSLERPGAWVRKVAMRLAWRRSARERARAELETLTETTPHPGWRDLDLVVALGSLPDRQAAALLLHHLADWPISEVAERLECTPGAAKVLLMRGRRRLRGTVGG